MVKKNSKKVEKLEMPNIDLNEGPFSSPAIEDSISNENLFKMHEELKKEFNQLRDRSVSIEWHLFGKEYKGKYKYLDLGNGSCLFGDDISNIKHLEAKSAKEAYIEFNS